MFGRPIYTLDRFLTALENLGIVSISHGYDVFQTAVHMDLYFFIGK
jgi:hypothetical protein